MKECLVCVAVLWMGVPGPLSGTDGEETPSPSQFVFRQHLIDTGLSGNGFGQTALVDLNGDGDADIFTCEMEHVRGRNAPRWFIWENLDGRGGAWEEHAILDANLGGHAAWAGDLTGDGQLDLIGKPWTPHPQNALGGRRFVVFLENISKAGPSDPRPTPSRTD